MSLENIIITKSYRNILCYSRLGGKHIIQLYGILSCCAGMTDVHYASGSLSRTVDPVLEELCP